MPSRMTDDEVKAFLDAKPGWVILSTFGPNGYPHSVPIGYFRLGDDVYLGCRAATQKIKNIERNPKVSLVLESGSTRQDIKGIMIQGHATVYTDPKIMTFQGPIMIDMPCMFEFVKCHARLEKQATELLDFMDLKKVD